MRGSELMSNGFDEKIPSSSWNLIVRLTQNTASVIESINAH